MISLDLRLGPFQIMFSLGRIEPEPVETVTVPGPGAQSAALDLATPAPVGFTPEEKHR